MKNIFIFQVSWIPESNVTLCTLCSRGSIRGNQQIKVYTCIECDVPKPQLMGV